MYKESLKQANSIGKPPWEKPTDNITKFLDLPKDILKEIVVTRRGLEVVDAKAEVDKLQLEYNKIMQSYLTATRENRREFRSSLEKVAQYLIKARINLLNKQDRLATLVNYDLYI